MHILIVSLPLKHCIAELPLRLGLTCGGSSVIRRFKHSDAIEIRSGITFVFYAGLPRMSYKQIASIIFIGLVSVVWFIGMVHYSIVFLGGMLGGRLDTLTN